MTTRMVQEWECDKCGALAHQNPGDRLGVLVPPTGWTMLTMTTHWCEKHEAPTTGAVATGFAVGLGQPGAEPPS